MLRQHVHNSIFGALFFSLALILSSGCSAPTGQATQLGGTFSCTAGATVASGDPNQANAVLQLSNVVVNMFNGTTGGTYSVNIANVGSFSTSATSYTIPQTISVQTGASGGYSAAVSVTNSADSAVANCTLYVAGSASAGSPTVAVVGPISVSAYPAGPVAVGSTITLSASVVSGSPSYSFTIQNPQSGVVLSNASATTATITSSVATSVTVLVAAYGTSTSVAGTAITLTFTGSSSGGTGSIFCQLAHSPSVAVVGQRVSFYVISSAPGQAIVNSFDPGEPATVNVPVPSPISGAYQTPGPKSVSMLASVNGIPCNSGAILTDSVSVVAANGGGGGGVVVRTGLAGMYWTPMQNTHVVGGYSCPAGFNKIGSIADCGNGTCYGNQSVCTATAPFAPGTADPTPVILDVKMTPEGTHVVGGIPCPPNYQRVGFAADCGGGTCYGNQNVCALVAPAFALPPGQSYVKAAWITPENSHIVGGGGCPSGYSMVGSFADCGYGRCYGNQNVCIARGNL
jgi:hypothetical protein